MMVKQEITDKIYSDFMNHKIIVTRDRKTFVDMWVSYIAFIFDYNFISGLRYIKEKDYINILIDRFKFQNADTRFKMEEIRKCAHKYIDDRLKD